MMSSGSLVGRFFLYFGASSFQAAISFISLPLSTRILNPSDFGAFAIVTALFGVAALIAEGGATVVLSGSLRAAAPAERRTLTTTVLATTAALSVLSALTLFFAWDPFAALIHLSSDIPRTAVLLGALSVLPNALWAVASFHFVIAGRARTASVLTVAMSLASLTSLVVCLYGLHLGMLSLFVASFFSLAVGGFGALLCLKREMGSVELRWLREIWRAAPSSIAAGLVSGAQSLVERSVLTSQTGLSTLGLYIHSQQYSAVLARPIKAVAFAAWPVSLDEARDGGDDFPRIGSVWRPVYVMVIGIGVALGAFGQEIIGVLTSGKFVAAAPLLPAWIAYILLQNSGKASTAVIFARGDGRVASRISVATNGLAACLVFGLVPTFGVWGALVALLISALAFRVCIGTVARRGRRIAFQDGWIVSGIVILLSLSALLQFVDPPFAARAALGFAVLASLVVLGRNELRDALSRFRGALA